MQALKLWLRLASREQKTKFFNDIESSSSYVSQIVNGHANTSVSMAARIEKAAADNGNDRMPVVKRGEMCETCSQCPYYIKCQENA